MTFREATPLERELTVDRDRWIRRFNRLEAAVRRHADTKDKSGFADEADDALHAAFRAVMKEATKP